MTPTETMYNQLTPENRQRVNQRIDALLIQQKRDKLTQEAAALFKSLSWEDQQAYLYRLQQKADRQTLERLAFELLMMLDEDTRLEIMRPYIERIESRRARRDG